MSDNIQLNTVSAKEVKKFDVQLKVASAREIKKWDGIGKKPLATLIGKISEADIVNANGFIIPLQEWHDMLTSNIERIKQGKCYCTVGHDERPVEDYDVRHGEISHIITDMWIEGKDVFMSANVCDTQSGNDLMGVIGAGGYIQASTRLGIVPRKDEVTGADCLVGAESIIYGVDLVLDPAIESTWIEFKAASKEKSNKDNNNSQVINPDLSNISKCLKKALSNINDELEYQKRINNLLKR